MARKFRAQVELTAEDRASREIQKAESSFSRLSRGLRVGLVAAAAAATVGLRAFVSVVRGAVSAAQAQEDAIARLDQALKPLGPAYREVSKAAQEQATALQQVNRFGDEQIINAQALLATLGVQADRMGTATQATVDLAAALGISLESAARNVGKTVGGFAGELGEVIPELKDLSTESLRAGEGIDLLAAKFSGSAAAQARTFAGVISQISNAYGDLGEQAGFAITENESLLEVLQTIRAVLLNQRTTQAVRDTADAMADLVASLSGLEGSGTEESIDRISTAIFQLGERFRILVDSMQVVFNGLQALSKIGILDFSGAMRDAQEAVDAFNREADRLKDSVVGLNPALGTISGTSRELRDAMAESGASAAVLHAELLGIPTASQRAARSLESLKSKTDAAGGSARDLAGSYESALESAAAFGETTSAQLGAEITKIQVALIQQRQILGENSAEYRRLEEVASEKILLIQERIESLRAGLGDLKRDTGDTTDAYEDLARSTDRLVESQRTLSRQVNEGRRAWDVYRDGLVDTRFEFDRVAESAGRAVAAAQAVEAGARQFGNRVFLPLGGGRFVTEPGFDRGNDDRTRLSGGTFTTITPRSII